MNFLFLWPPKALFRRSQKGQGMVEYAFILILVAIAVVILVALIGGHVGNFFHQVNNSYPGGPSPSPTSSGSGLQF